MTTTTTSTTSSSPTHPDLFRINHQPGAFASNLISVTTFTPGQLITRITTHTPSKNQYDTIQTSRTEYVKLNSDLVFCNHSCSPSVFFDVDALEVRALKHIAPGEELTVFYPSTEWDMVQPFECICKSEGCFGVIKGAAEMDEESLGKYRLNRHIVELLEERKGEKKDLGKSSL